MLRLAKSAVAGCAALHAIETGLFAIEAGHLSQEDKAPKSARRLASSFRALFGAHQSGLFIRPTRRISRR